MKRAAAERLAEAALPAAQELRRLIRRGRPDHVKLGAAQAVLDRTGHAKTTKIALDVTGLAEAIAGLDEGEVRALAEQLEEGE